MKNRRSAVILGLSLGLSAISALQTYGQERKQATVEVRKDTVLVVKGRSDMRIKVYEEVPAGKGESREVYCGVFVDRINESSNDVLDILPFLPKKKSRSDRYVFTETGPLFYFMFTRQSTGAVRYNTSFPQKGGGSFEWGFNFLGSTICKREHVGLTYSAGFAYTRYRFDANAALDRVDRHIVWQSAPEGVDYVKSWMRYWTFRVPLCLEWQPNRKISFAAGPELEARFAMKSKARYAGDTHTMTSSMNTNPIGANLYVQVGIKNIQFVGRFGLTPLMDSSRAPKLYHSSLGIGISL